MICEFAHYCSHLSCAVLRLRCLTLGSSVSLGRRRLRRAATPHPEIPQLDLPHASVGMMEDEPLDIAVMEPFAQAVEGARDVVIALRGAMGLQDVPLESLDIALNLRSEELIGPLGKVIEGFAEP